MLMKIRTATISGVEGHPVTVETDLRRGMPEFAVVGLADTTIREACKRLRPAIMNSGYAFPNERITVNLVPADQPKVGSHFDLPIAISIILLMAGQEIPEDIAILGEVSLDGSVNPVHGVLPLVISLRAAGIRTILLPYGNAEEASVLRDVRILPVATIRQAAEHIMGREKIPVYRGSRRVTGIYHSGDFSQVIGQETAKRAMVIGAAGDHGMMMMGSPGCGKTMLARRLPTILPPLTYEEKLEIMGIHSVAGLLQADAPVIEERPFRSPHHSITTVGLIGGGSRAKPGELSLAHRGVLFLDELGEFDSRVIDALRQPIEDGFVRIVRRQEEVIFPARVMVVVASNPCKCGNRWDERKICTCNRVQLANYYRKLSGPFSDRIDMHIKMVAVEQKDLFQDGKPKIAAMTSRRMREQVMAARERQASRFRGSRYISNGMLDEAGIEQFCRLDDECRQTMRWAFDKIGLTMRGYHRVLKIARTIADLEASDEIREGHLMEALAYRSAEMEEVTSYESRSEE